MTLYICKHNKALEEQLDCLLAALTKEDAILLIEDAVYQALNNTSCPAKIHVLIEDLCARGIQEKVNTAMNIIDYAGFVNLTETHQRIISL